MSDKQLPDGIEWPRFEDGELVKIGDWLEHDGRTKKVVSVAYGSKGLSIAVKDDESVDSIVIDYCHYIESLKRPPVLDKDGIEIKVSDTVYGRDGRGWRVDGFDYASKYSVHAHNIVIHGYDCRENVYRDLKPEWLTHMRPMPMQSVEFNGEEFHVNDRVYDWTGTPWIIKRIGINKSQQESGT